MTQTYTGSCHCGAVRYEVDLDLKNAISCNCSICMRTGSLLTFSAADTFKLLSGEEALSDYQFNQKSIHHLFCKTCGVRSFARGKTSDGKPMVAINVRCLEDIDLAELAITPFDGKSR